MQGVIWGLGPKLARGTRNFRGVISWMTRVRSTQRKATETARKYSVFLAARRRFSRAARRLSAIISPAPLLVARDDSATRDSAARAEGARRDSVAREESLRAERAAAIAAVRAALVEPIYFGYDQQS